MSIRRRRSFKDKLGGLSCVACCRTPTATMLKPELEPPMDHTAVLRAANKLLQRGVITESEFHKIVNGDLKFRKQEARHRMDAERGVRAVVVARARSNSCPEFEVPRDPVTLEPLGKHTFTLSLEGGAKVVYNLDSLVTFLMSTDSFAEPTTRAKLSQEQIEEVEARAHEAGLLPRSTSLLERFLNPDTDRQETMRQLEESARNFDTILGDVVTELMGIIEAGRDRRHDDDVQVALLCSEFERTFSMLKGADLEMAFQCLDMYTSFLTGPQHRPTRHGGGHNAGALRTVLKFLRLQWTAEDQRHLDELRGERQQARECVLSEGHPEGAAGAQEEVTALPASSDSDAPAAAPREIDILVMSPTAHTVVGPVSSAPPSSVPRPFSA